MVYKINEKELTDGTKIHNVSLTDDNGLSVTIACSGLREAHGFISALGVALNKYTVETLETPSRLQADFAGLSKIIMHFSQIMS